MFKKKPFNFLLILLLLCSNLFSQTLQKPLADDATKFTTVGNIGITISNYGTFGDGFAQQSPVDQPSCIYPRDSGIEHLFGGGLWVGAETPDGVKVTTGAFNVNRFQTAGANNFEFTTTDDPNDLTIERSSLPENKFFSPEAISHQDFVSDFADTNIFIPGTSVPIPNHIPMGLGVHLETYAWNFPFADAFVIFNYTITNVWDDTLKDVYVGLWADLVVRNINITPSRVGSPFYQHAGIGYADNDSMQFVYAYDYDGDPGFTDSYVAMVLLGSDAQANDQLYDNQITHNWWLFSGGVADYEQPPYLEEQKYSRMVTSFNDNIYWNTPIYQTGGNWMSLISTGPYQKIEPDSSINVVFAFVCAKKFGFNPSTIDDDNAKKNLVDNVGWAQRAYYGEDSNRNGVLDYVGTDSTEDITGDGKLNRYILPTPPTPPHLKAIPQNQKVTLLWDNSSEESIDLISKNKDFEGYRVYRSFIGDERSSQGIFNSMKLIHEYDLKNNLFYDTGLEAITMADPIMEIEYNSATGLNDTVEYKYKLEIDNLHNGWQYAFAVSAFDSGDVTLNLNSLESSKLQNVLIVTPGTAPQSASVKKEIGVYPNPYRVNALWDGTFERERKLYFYNLPKNCEVRIYTLAGDLIDGFTHRGSESGIINANGIAAGGEHSWDIVSESDQAIATGLYLFTVKDTDNGEIYKGKFVVIK